MEKILNKIGNLIILITILIFSIIIGANEKELRVLPISVILLIGIIYLLSRKIIFKEKITIKNKCDIAILFFTLSTILPLIFNTYCTLQGVINFIIKYGFIYTFYLIVRNTKIEEKDLKIITLVIILGSIIIAVFGIDMLNENKLYWIIKKLNLNYINIPIYTKVLGTTFSYTNTSAIYFLFCSFLALKQIQKNSKIYIKILYTIYWIFCLIMIYLTHSRMVIILTFVSIIFYFIVYYKEKIQNTIIKNKKKILWGSVLILILFVSYIIIGLNSSEELKIEDVEYTRIININFKPNTKYEIEMEMQNSNQNLEVGILEINKYFNEKILTSQSVENIDGKIKFEIETDDNVFRVEYFIKNNVNKNVNIKNFYVDGKKCIQHFKYMPDRVGTLIKTGILSDTSFMERLDFWRASIEIFKESPIIGQGGDTWKALYQTVSSHPEEIKETHSFLFELLIEYGIVGTVLYFLYILIFNYMVIKQIRKKNDKNNLAILFAIDVLLLHSLFFDFNMSFIIIQLLVNCCIALIVNTCEEELKNKYVNYIDYIIITLLIANFVLVFLGVYAKYISKDREKSQKVYFYNTSVSADYIAYSITSGDDKKIVLDELIDILKKFPYSLQINREIIYMQELLSDLDNLTDDELVKYISFINEFKEKYKFSTPLYADSIISNAQYMEKLYLALNEKNYDNTKINEQVERLKNNIINEHDNIIKYIEDTARNGKTQEEVDELLKQYDEIISIIKN